VPLAVFCHLPILASCGLGLGTEPGLNKTGQATAYHLREVRLNQDKELQVQYVVECVCVCIEGGLE
jgi:hypothetical protein